ncbi:hypothetical protein BSL78_08206 [Apostichopus japonicus]|uniref:Uncharacterized protein n=1 Tax=Stichopus japonicus TaxID=307972 RepID=A0A2G8L3Z9_STIJA|nr:hypothetical protein BSL78_08206 [Apostichopus japonicus]
MEFNNIFMITVIAAAFICFRLEVEGAISTEELTPEQKKDCVKWEEFNNGYCPPGTYKNDTDGECLNCPEGSYMKWFNTCPMCIRFTVCDEGDVVSCPGDTTNDRSCADPQPATAGGWVGGSLVGGLVGTVGGSVGRSAWEQKRRMMMLANKTLVADSDYK